MTFDLTSMQKNFSVFFKNVKACKHKFFKKKKRHFVILTERLFAFASSSSLINVLIFLSTCYIVRLLLRMLLLLLHVNLILMPIMLHSQCSPLSHIILFSHMSNLKRNKYLSHFFGYYSSSFLFFTCLS